MSGNHIAACCLLVFAYIVGAGAAGLWLIPLGDKSRKRSIRKYWSLGLLAVSVMFLEGAVIVGQCEGNFAQRWTAAWSQTFQFFSLDASYTEIIKEAADAFPNIQWMYPFYILSCIYVIIAPIVGGVFFLDVLTSAIPRLKLAVSIKKTKFVFSELNERSITLAENIAKLSWQLKFPRRRKDPFENENIDFRERKWLKSACIVFTDAYTDKESEISSELLARAKQIGAICLKDDILERPFHWYNPFYWLNPLNWKNRGRKIVYFLIDTKAGNNFTAALSLLGDKQNLWRSTAKHEKSGGMDMYVFTPEQESVRLIDEARARLEDFAPILVKCVNEYRNVVYKMFDDRKLVTSLLTEDEPTQSPFLSVWDSFRQSDKKEMRIVILGAGRLAREYIKSVPWYLQMLRNLKRGQGQDVEKEYKTIPIRIMVFAKDARYLEQQLKGECKELFEADCEAKFFDVDFLSEEFVREFNGQKAEEAQRYLVALGDDIVNHNAALWLWREIKKHNSVTSKQSSCIVDFAIEDDELFDKIQDETESNENDGIYMRPFSTMGECFSYKNVRMDDLEQRALQADQAHEPKATMKFLSAYNRDSSIASALHMICKILSLCPNGMKSKKILGNMIMGTNPVQSCENQIYWLEHRRWCAYMRTQGYTCPTAKQFIDIAYTISKKSNENFVCCFNRDMQKNAKLRLHACLLPSDADCRLLTDSLRQVVEKWYANEPQKKNKLLTEISFEHFREIKKIMTDKIAALKEEIVRKHGEEEDERLAGWLSKMIDLGEDNNKLDALDRLSVLATLTMNENDEKGYIDFKSNDIEISRMLYREVMQLRVKNLYDECFAPKHIAETSEEKSEGEKKEANNKTPEERLETAMLFLRKTFRDDESLLAVSYGEESHLIMLLEEEGKNCFGTLCTEDDAVTTKKKQRNKTIFKHGILRKGWRLVEVPCHGTVCLGRIKKTEGNGRKQDAVFMHLYQKSEAKTDKERYLELELDSPRALSEKRLKKILDRLKAEREECDKPNEQKRKNPRTIIRTERRSNKMKTYTPRPIDTKDVEVGQDILELAERLAENTHEVWAVGKLAEGWKYGETLDREKKTHPLLVPYSELAESDKDYDRRTSLETLKLLIKLGYKIEKK